MVVKIHRTVLIAAVRGIVTIVLAYLGCWAMMRPTHRPAWKPLARVPWPRAPDDTETKPTCNGCQADRALDWTNILTPAAIDEIDETYVGGKAKNTYTATNGPEATKKAIVMTVIDRSLDNANDEIDE